MWAWLNHKHLGYQDVGLSHELVVQNKQFWRIVSSQLSHVDFVHLLFNMTSLWSLGGYEQGGKNSSLVLQQSLWLLVGAGLVRLGWLDTGAMYLTISSQYIQIQYMGQQRKLLCAVQICLAMYHGLIHVFHKEQYRSVTAVGYSAVIFGWMALLSARKQSRWRKPTTFSKCYMLSSPVIYWLLPVQAMLTAVCSPSLLFDCIAKLDTCMHHIFAD